MALHVLAAITLEGFLWLSSELGVTSASYEAAETWAICTCFPQSFVTPWPSCPTRPGRLFWSGPPRDAGRQRPLGQLALVYCTTGKAGYNEI